MKKSVKLYNQCINDEIFMENYRKGSSSQEIATYLNLKPMCSVLYQTINLLPPREEKIRIPLPTLWDERTAYLYGYILGDGSLGKKKNTNKEGRKYGIIEIVSIDKDHLETLSQLLGNTNITKQTHVIKGKDVVVYRLRFVNSPWYNFCEDMGLLPNKSNKELYLKLPDNINFPHFVRGLYDSDGGVCVFKGTNGTTTKLYTKCQAYFYGGPSYLDSIIDKVPVELHKGSQGKLSKFYVSDLIQLEKLFDFLYKDATIYMKRKHLKLLNYIKLKK